MEQAGVVSRISSIHDGALHAAPGVKLYARGEHAEGAAVSSGMSTISSIGRLKADARVLPPACSIGCLDHRVPVLGAFALFVAGSLCLARWWAAILPQRRRGIDEAARTRSRRHAPGDYGADLRRHRR